MTQNKWLTEDKLALILGLVLFGLSLLNFGGVDPLGWAVKSNVWLQGSQMFSSATGAYKGMRISSPREKPYLSLKDLK